MTAPAPKQAKREFMNIIQGVIVGLRKEVILMEKLLEINQD